jgi:hypothetical protein
LDARPGNLRFAMVQAPAQRLGDRDSSMLRADGRDRPTIVETAAMHQQCTMNQTVTRLRKAAAPEIDRPRMGVGNDQSQRVEDAGRSA